MHRRILLSLALIAACGALGTATARRADASRATMDIEQGPYKCSESDTCEPGEYKYCHRNCGPAGCKCSAGATPE